MQPDKVFKLYKGSVEIEFYETKHWYKHKGERSTIISVTGAVGMVDKSRPLIIWATRLAKDFLLSHVVDGVTNSITKEIIEQACNLHQVKKEEAASKGSEVHKWAEDYISGKNPELPTDEKVLNGVMAFLSWVKEHSVKFKESERMIYSKKHDFVGTLDAIAVIGGKTSLIDFKTSNGIYSTMHYQVAGYQLAYEEETGKKLSGPRYIIRFDKDTGDFHVHNLDEDEKDYKKDCAAFLAALTLKKREKELSTWGD